MLKQKKSPAPVEKKERLRFRFATREDMHEVWRLDRLNLQVNWDFFPITTGPLKGADLIRRHYDIINRWYMPERHKIVVARLGELVVGEIWYTVEPDAIFDVNVGFLFSISVDPRFRGQGIGRRLLREFKRRVYKDGAKYVRLAVLHNNITAQNLYRQEGFFDDTHYMIARLEPTEPEKRKAEAAERKTDDAKNKSRKKT